MVLRQTHQIKLKMKSICTTQKKKVISSTWNGRQTKMQKTHIYMTHHNPNLGGIIDLLLLVYFVDDGEDYIIM